LTNIYKDAILPFSRANQREITSFLESKKINCSALPEVFELCRALQQVIQKRVSSSSSSVNSAAFGTTNSLLFLVVFTSLVPVKSLFELLTIILENCEKQNIKSTTAIIQMASATFATIDTENAKTWKSVAVVFAKYPGVNLNLLLELFPSIESMGTGSSSFVDDVEEKFFEDSNEQDKQQQEAKRPTIVRYDENDDGQDKTDQDEEEDEDEEVEDLESRNDFWTDLTSGPK
jgi:hypothetical protein